MKCLKLFLVLGVVIISFCAFFVPSAAAMEEDGVNKIYDDFFKSSGALELFGSLDDETKELLSKLGVDSLTLDSLLNLSPKRVVALIIELLTGKAGEILRFVFVLFAVLIFISLIDCFIDSDSKLSGQFGTFYLIFFAVILMPQIITCVSNAVSAIRMLAGFSKLLIPVMAGIITVSGNPLLALGFNSLTFSAAEIISAFSSSFLTPLAGVNLSLSVAGAFNPLLKTKQIGAVLKKFVTVALSLIITLFVGLLTIKGFLADAADTLAMKGTKFALSTFIPVIGGSVGEALSSLTGSLTLLSSVVGVVGIIVLVLIVLPSLIEIVLWRFVLFCASFFCSLLGSEKIADMLESFSAAIVILAVILIFSAFIFIISTGLILSLSK